jgi:hypothetical protein
MSDDPNFGIKTDAERARDSAIALAAIKAEHAASGKDPKEFNVNNKSPWLYYALLQIPIVIIMALMLYFMYKAANS